MASDNSSLQLNGGSISRQTINKIATAASHSDDYVFAELLKLAPFDGTHYAKVVVPYQAHSSISPNNSSLVTGVSTGGHFTVLVLPFRAIVGSRILAASSPPSPADPIIPTSPELAYRDIRSAVLATAGAPISTPSGLGYYVPYTQFLANSSGNPRWDLVYAALYIDQPSTPTSILVKPATGGATGPVTASETAVCSVGSPPGASNAIGVVTGTPGATPALPSAPADNPGSGIFYFPIAYVQIPNGFSPGAAPFTATQICTVAVPASIATAMGGTRVMPMPAITGSAAVSLTGATWGSAGTRPPTYLPSTMIGEEVRHFLLDAQLIVGSGPLNDAAILDTTIDWRNRYFWSFFYAKTGTSLFASDPAAGATGFIPRALDSIPGVKLVVQPGQSFHDDSTTMGVSTRNAGVVCFADNAHLSDINAGGIGLYVDLVTGNLRLLYQGTPLVRAVITIRATGSFDNFA